MTKIDILDHGYIQLIESWGSDERIIEAARMSTDGEFRGWGPIHTEECKANRAITKNFYEKSGCICNVKPGDEKLLASLYTNKHMTPFEMAGAIIEVQAPIFVFREWHRHRTQSYNEFSARYTELPDLCYIPSVDRLMAGGQSKTNKQASGESITEIRARLCQINIKAVYDDAMLSYKEMLSWGLSRELARLVIPVNQYSRMRASANLRNWLAFLTLRMDAGAQWEIRQYANALHDILKDIFPRTMELFDGKL